MDPKLEFKVTDYQPETKCDSLENLTDEEFLVYDFENNDKCEKGNAEASQIKGTCSTNSQMENSNRQHSICQPVDCSESQPGNNDTPVRQRINTTSSDDSDVIREKLADAMMENSRTTSEESIGTNGGVGKPMTECEKVPSDLKEKRNCDGVIGGTELIDDIIEGLGKGLAEKAIENIVSNYDTHQYQSIEEMLNALDSNVGVHVDDSNREMEEADESDMYAVCQELLDDPSGDSRLSSDMRSTSCHSLEDLLEEDQDKTENIPMSMKGYAHNAKNKTNKQGIRRLSTDSAARNKWKQSLGHGKDALDGIDPSGTDVDEGAIEQGMLTPPKVPKSTSCPESVIAENSSSTSLGQYTSCSSSPNKHSTRGTKSETSAIKEIEATDDVAVRQNSHRRQMSLEIPAKYHAGQDLVPSPVLNSLSRLSPKFGQGSRTFVPKRFSVQRKISQSPIKLFRQLPIVKNYYMSPLLAPDDLLMKLPEIHLAVSITSYDYLSSSVLFLQ